MSRLADIIDGKQIAELVRQESKELVSDLRSRRGITPGLTVVLVGDDPASAVYVRNKEKACQEAGILVTTHVLPSTVTETTLLNLFDQLNNDSSCHGILVQLPLPKNLNTDKVIEKIDPMKDVDGLHPLNMGLLAKGSPRFVPATPAGIQQLLGRSGFDPAGKSVVVLGRSNIVGKPLALLLMQKHKGANATVTVCHSATPSLESFTSKADILIAALGSANAVTGDMLKPGSVVIDVGINRVEDSTRPKGYRLVGDVDFESAQYVAKAITPVPGGVGPMTIAMLINNTYHAAMLSVG